ncbi:hypothetical protein KKH27_00285 [bacterium]|nr:hypothetical protein [bacterium]MBU1983513.1 hypothetical protein [bacterium]
MNLAQLHLAFNHIPMMGLGFGLMVLVYGLIRRSADVQRAALLVFLLAALAVFPAYLTGDGAADVIKGLPDISEQRIEQHEDAAVTAQVMMILVGLATLGGLYLLHKQKSLKVIASVSILALSVISLLVMLYTASLGGKIHHPELRAGYVVPAEVEDGD